jgi:3-methyladenine DNA glycosylase AlkD
MNSQLLSKIRQDLKEAVDEKISASYSRFFKEPVKFYGVELTKVSKIARKWFSEVKLLQKPDILDLCEELLKSDFNEEAFIASELSYLIRDKFEEHDFTTFERWIKYYINNWAKCDSLCNHAVGAFIEKYPGYIERLKHWTRSENRWVRRASAVTLIIPAKQGKFLKDIFEIADSLLLDKDDLVQKGYGWLLKDAAIKHQQEIFDYVMRNRQVMPRTAFRYAIERFPPDLRKKAMGK